MGGLLAGDLVRGLVAGPLHDLMKGRDVLGREAVRQPLLAADLRTGPGGGVVNA